MRLWLRADGRVHVARIDASDALEAHFGDRVVRCFVDRPRNANALFAEALARNRDGEALVCGDQRLTWRALDDAVARVACGLTQCGIARGDRIALLLGNRAEL